MCGGVACVVVLVAKTVSPTVSFELFCIREVVCSPIGAASQDNSADQEKGSRDAKQVPEMRHSKIILVLDSSIAVCTFPS